LYLETKLLAYRRNMCFINSKICQRTRILFINHMQCLEGSCDPT